MKTKKISEMTPEERAAYQRDWYSKKIASKSAPLVITINNCPDDLRAAILEAIKGDANV